MKFWIIYILVEISFLGDCFSEIFLRQPTMVADNFTQSPTPLHHEKASCGPAIKIIEKYQWTSSFLSTLQPFKFRPN